jgi:hypothetical protein
MQPIAQAGRVASVKPECRRLRVRVPSTTRACQEYLDGAEILRAAGLTLAASMLEATGDALRRPPVSLFDEDTVVEEIPIPPITTEPK